MLISISAASASASALTLPLASLLVLTCLSSSAALSDDDGNVNVGLSADSNSQISTNVACQADVTRICGKKPENLPDLDALECILNQKRNAVDDVSDACNNALWHYRKSITEQQGFLQLADRTCIEEFKKTGCESSKDGGAEASNMVTCIIDNKDKIDKSRCQALITRLEGVIFGDYEMVGKFTQDCEKDIKRHKCGRNEVETALKKLPHSQGKTIECLSEKVPDLLPECSVQILRVAELQSDDFHLDRALYFACRDDREKFCSRVQAGNGRVYKCLLRHKLEIEMSNECREQIYRRQKLGWQDYKASGIVASCRDEIKKYKCRKRASSSDKPVRLSQILLCLENEFHKGQDVGGDCMDEIKQHRKSLLDNFSVTPELLAACMEDKERYCAEKGIHGKTLHCLMAHAQMRKPEERIKDKCRVELENLLKISDVSSDWQIDPVLKQSCQRVVDSSSCSKYPPNKVLNCLMNILTTDSGPDANIMTDECEDTLLQIQYFLARDFPMDSLLFETCSKDAQRVCGTKADWASDPNQMEPERGPIVLSCLFRNMASDDPNKIISPQCAQRVRETMRQRALSVHLLPEIEDACMDDLTEICSESTKPGEELQCLQTHLDDLEKTCQAAVSNFTAVEMKNPTVDPFLWRHCRDYIEDKCGKDKSTSEDDDVLDCLVDLKPEMKNKKCRVSIEHMQLLKLKEVRFTPKFKAQCQSDVIRYCNGKDMQPLTSWKVVHCLSETIRDDIVRENTLRISKGCRKQVRNLLLAKLQLENGIVDAQSVYKVCGSYIEDLCAGVQPGGGRVLECLRDHANNIQTNSECHEALFKVEQETDTDTKLDLVLNADCTMEIRLFCSNEPDLMQCLKLSTEKQGFSSKCARIVRERLIEQGSDARLNPRLTRACKLDVRKFCPKVLPGQGRIIGCLKNVFVNPKNRLTDTCKVYIEDMMEHAAKEDIKYDSDLYASCKNYVQQCQNNKLDDREDEPDKGQTEECLKQLYREKKVHDESCRRKIAVLIQSTMIDIHVDPILNQACAIDLVRHCDGVPPGDGRLLKCLFAQLHEEKDRDDKTHLSERCRDLLGKRGELFQLAGEAGSGGHMESLVDLVEHVQSSSHKNYFLVTGMTIVGLVFIFGLFCGRVTHRRAAEKNK